VAAVGLTPQPPPPDPESAITISSNKREPIQATSDTSARQPSPKGPPAKSRSELLTRAFARQQPSIARCFSKNASDVSGSPEIAVRFEVGSDGHVLSAQVQPAALGSTPLGQCIATVARGTDFGPQPETTTFRIPITAKRGP
jgi:hypothetical protein